MNDRTNHFPMQRRRGVILIAALGIIVILSGLVLVFAQSMRTEATASANRLSYQQADAIELGAEQWVLAQVQNYQTDAVSLTQVPAAGLQVGSGYFWILQPDSQSDQTYEFGITDESSKLNLNAATAAELQLLPVTIQQNIADEIVDWRSPAAKASADGAESSVYNNLPEPYNCKNAPYETVEELLLVKDVTPRILFGFDLNRDGVIDAGEQSAGNSQGLQLNSTSTNDSRGIFNYLTVYSMRPATARAAGGGQGASAAPPASVVGLINVNTASQQVLMCLPGMTTASAQQIVSSRASNTSAKDTAWVQKIVGQNIYRQIGPLITATSYQYSADIVAVSGDGRSFKRVRIVVDVQKTPAKIVYRKDMTSLGWPLPPDVRTALRAGQGLPADATDNGSAAIGAGQMIGH